MISFQLWLNNMNELLILKKLHNERVKGCVAYGKDAGVTYFSIEGLRDTLPNDHKIKEMIKEIFGKSIFVGIEYSYAYIKPIIKYDDPNHKVEPYPKSYDSLFFRLNNGFAAGITFNELENPIGYWQNAYDKRYNRYWTCAEKKIFNYTNGKVEVYITKKPCYFCLPVVTKCHYLDNKKMYTLEENCRKIGYRNFLLFKKI